MAHGETVLRLKEKLAFDVHTPSGFDFVIDSGVDAAEPLTGPTPMELQLVALGGCTGMDAISILRKMRQDVTGYEVRLTQTRATAHPKVYTAVQLTHALRGRNLSEANVRRAIELTMARYCPVFHMLYPNVEISERFEITDDASGAVTAGDVPVPPQERARTAS